jgi:hypothetical protein
MSSTSASSAPGAPLRTAAVAFRIFHGTVAIGFLAAIAYIWWCVFTGRRDVRLRASIAALVIEAGLVGANGGDCPLGPLQDRLGDPVPLFELVLGPAAARRAIPVLGVIAGTGIALAARPRR